MNRYLSSINDLSHSEIFDLLKKTREIKENMSKDKGAYADLCRHKMMGLMFYQPSTRTSGSFKKAMTFLGGWTYEFDTESSSVAKGEDLEDTARMVAMGCDILVFRHQTEGITKHLGENVLKLPVLNAGEGTGEHPTQALLDLFTIWEKFNYTEDFSTLTVGFYGDLKHGRACHSLFKILDPFGVQFICLPSTKELQLPNTYQTNKEQLSIANSLEDGFLEVDVLYVERLRKEYIEENKSKEYEMNMATIKSEHLEKMKESAILMHPLPRNNEISRECDSNPRAVYFQQAENGIFMRMALILHYLGINI